VQDQFLVQVDYPVGGGAVARVDAGMITVAVLAYSRAVRHGRVWRHERGRYPKSAGFGLGKAGAAGRHGSGLTFVYLFAPIIVDRLAFSFNKPTGKYNLTSGSSFTLDNWLHPPALGKPDQTRSCAEPAGGLRSR
jgi:hypothetical protein